ncbi:DUF308 domain-containing protein [Massilia sp. DWR3-1-1]|uniref:DUF308 domain-containing protein n=1 Tax=Massilia sp. DWR3-1-1 TaxID=2804559 RepID=UPI003CE79DE9
MQQHAPQPGHNSPQSWLKTYYFSRAAFALAWIGAVLAFARSAPAVAAVLMVAYPAWDAIANLVDASRSGGMARNQPQAVNALVSVVTALAVAIALPDMHLVLGVFGAWAILAGVLQLGAGLRRWKSAGAQWAMVLSGAQSALAGGFFIVQAGQPAMPAVTGLVGYAGFGAFYFLVSALWLSVAATRRARKAT